jgi:hypothetical protein
VRATEGRLGAAVGSAQVGVFGFHRLLTWRCPVADCTTQCREIGGSAACHFHHGGEAGGRLGHLITLIETAQEAERVAIAIHKHGADGEALGERTEVLLDRLWTRLRAVQLICPTEVGEAARDLAGKAHDLVREGPTDQQSVTTTLRPVRARLITMARIDLERV